MTDPPPPSPETIRRLQHDAAVLRALIQVLAPEAAAAAIAHAAAAVRRGGAIDIMGGGILDDDQLGPATAVLLNVTFMNLSRRRRLHGIPAP